MTLRIGYLLEGSLDGWLGKGLRVKLGANILGNSQ